MIIACDEHETQGIFATYSDQPPMTFMAHVGSTGRLELAIVDENASAMLGVKVGAPVSRDVVSNVGAFDERRRHPRRTARLGPPPSLACVHADGRVRAAA